MTKEQYIRENKDLRTRLENLKIVRQMSEDGFKERIKWLEESARGKDRQIRMLQEYIASREAAYEHLVSGKASLQNELDKLTISCEKLQDTIVSLAARINRDSSNSSKPPSSDGLKKVIHNSRSITGKKPGGQPGHKGHGLGIPEKLKELIDSGATPVEVVEHGDPTTPFVSKYELDIRTTVSIREHRFHKGVTIPAELNNQVNYGSNVKTMCVYLSTVGLVAAERVSDFINDISDGALTPSKATVLAFQKEVSTHLDPEIDAIRKDILNASVLNTDETPLKSTQRPADENGTFEEAKHTTFNIYARTYSTVDSTLLTVHAHKDIAGIKTDNILPQYTMPMVHDHDIKLYNFGTGRHGECNTHIDRYLKDIFELTKHEWETQMAQLLLDILEHKNKDIANHIDSMDAEPLRRYSEDYDRIIQLAKIENATLLPTSAIRKVEYNLFSRLEHYKDNHLLFAYDYSVPFTNNRAEQDLRWIKTQQKVSGCHRSYEGTVIMMRLMSFISTLKKRKRPVWASLNDVLKNRPVLVSKKAKSAVA